LLIAKIPSPTGISITPKNIDNLVIHLGELVSKHFFHIHLVTKISPATIWAHVAVIPALVERPVASPSINPTEFEEPEKRSIKP
jgi:hypothetical protein